MNWKRVADNNRPITLWPSRSPDLTFCDFFRKDRGQGILPLLSYWFSGAKTGAVGSLVVRELYSTPEGLDSMSDATKYPPSTTKYVLVKSVGPKVLWAESRVQGTGEYFPPLQSHGKIVEVEIGGIAIYRPYIVLFNLCTDV
ncbi:hypothetical protein TNCV_4170911 [Trichonephila clavipes]|nr:hypothetical protein TNCV_4170911 [Trichonephila clavipes]